MQAQLRYTSQRLGQEQAKHNSQATLTRADIATLVQQGNVLLAREKAEKLIQENGFNDVVEAVEVELGVILDRFQEFEER
jgi:NACalpha-BTF3-like transcription factor